MKKRRIDLILASRKCVWVTPAQFIHTVTMTNKIKFWNKNTGSYVTRSQAVARIADHILPHSRLSSN